MESSIISGKSQPIQRLKIKGDIFSGVCTTKFQVYFENKRDEPIEISFSFPLPVGVCATHFDVKYNDETISSKISNSDDAKLDYDDALASSNFAAIVKNTGLNELRVDIGPLDVGEKCKLTLFYDVALSPIDKGYLLVLPTSISDCGKSLCLGLNPPPIKLKLNVDDVLPIEAITTPFTETKIDVEKGLVTSDNLSLFKPVHVVIKYKEINKGICLMQTEKGKTFMRITASTPTLKRQRPSQFSILMERSSSQTSSEFSVLLRALEFFVLSVPIGSKLNIANFGTASNALFKKPMLLNKEERAKAVAFARNPNVDKKVPISFKDALNNVHASVDVKEMESVVIIIGSQMDEDAEFNQNHLYFMLDPFSCGDLTSLAMKKGAIYLPVPDEKSLISSLLSVIKMTGSELYDNSFLDVDGEKIELPQIIPGMPFAFTQCVDKEKIDKIVFNFDKYFVQLKLVQSKLSIINHLWAIETINSPNCSDEEAKSIAIANEILAPDIAAVAVFEKDDEIDGDISHIETKMGAAGLQWVEKSLAKAHQDIPDPQPNPMPIPHPIPGPMPMPIPHPGPGPMPRPLPRPFWRRFDITRVFIRTNHESGKRGDAPEHSTLEDNVVTPRADDGKRIDIYEEIKKMRSAREAIKPKEMARKPFFLLRLLQVQNADGSWTDEKAMKICCGFNIPQETPSGFSRAQFITAFAIACLRAKAAKDEDSWELVANNAFVFLANENSSKNWEKIIEDIQSNLK